MSKIALIVEFETKSESRAAFIDLMRNHAEGTLADEEGCLQFDVLLPTEGNGRVFLYEVYRDEAALREALEGCLVAAPRPVWARPGVWVAGGLVCAASLGGALVAALSGPASEEGSAFVVDLPEPASPAAAGSSVSE